jgi:hypothetical protein
VQSCNCGLRNLLQRALALEARAVWHADRFLERWVDPRWGARMAATVAPEHASQAAAAIYAACDLFTDVCRTLQETHGLEVAIDLPAIRKQLDGTCRGVGGDGTGDRRPDLVVGAAAVLGNQDVAATRRWNRISTWVRPSLRTPIRTRSHNRAISWSPRPRPGLGTFGMPPWPSSVTQTLKSAPLDAVETVNASPRVPAEAYA